MISLSLWTNGKSLTPHTANHYKAAMQKDVSQKRIVQALAQSDEFYGRGRENNEPTPLGLFLINQPRVIGSPAIRERLNFDQL